MVMQIRHNFQITLPAFVRKKLKLKVGDILETDIKEGKVIITPKRVIDASQAWFWSEGWQEAEKEAQSDIRLGRVKKFKNAGDLIKDLDK